MTNTSLERASSEIGRLFALLTAIAMVALGLPRQAYGVTPAPDGGYPNGNTAEGDNALFSLTSGSRNTAIGFATLFKNTTGAGNTATGYQALFNNTTGGFNTSDGDLALFSNTTGRDNTASGFQALFHNTVGLLNTAIGANALYNNTEGHDNLANGSGALQYNTTGDFNTASGSNALQRNVDSSSNTAIGSNALRYNAAPENTAIGSDALRNNSTGTQNSASGYQALFRNTTGYHNTATGALALFYNRTGTFNTANGHVALYYNTIGEANTAVGLNALAYNTSGNNNIALGFLAGANLTIGSNNIDIGSEGVRAESNKIRIGTPGTQDGTFIAGIRGITTMNGNAVPVVIDSAGQLGTISSSQRFKEEIKPMNQTSEAILGLKPVTFHYKSDDQRTSQFGLIAEEVAKVNPDLVVRDDKGEVYTVRYDAVNAMLLNEFLKEHRKVKEQQTTIARLESKLAKEAAANARQQKKIEALTVGLQRVSAHIELSKSAPQLVGNDH